MSLAFLNKHQVFPSLQSRIGPVQGQNRVFPVKFSTQGKTRFHYRDPCFHYRDFPVRKLHRENPVFITGNGFAVLTENLITNIVV
jgi:hypothetical protein